MLLPRSILALAILLLANARDSTASAVDVTTLFPPLASTTPDIGSAQWSALYPPPGTTPPPRQLWLDALAQVVKAGLLPPPDVVPVAQNAAGWPTYGGLDGAGETICSNALGCHVASDGWDAPDGLFAINQDDGPLPAGGRLYDFYASNRISATHFLIGGNVITNWEVFNQSLNLPDEQHFGVHTWTHPYMTSLSNEDIISEIGWTMQILADNNNGLIPSFWRPPYGDVDNRVRAIAKEVFGLKTVLWNFDSEDWTIGTGAAESSILDAMNGKIMGPKSPGLLPLEHQLSDGAVDVFISIYPTLVAQGWKPMNVPDLWSLPWYANSDSANSSSASDNNTNSTDTFDGPPRNLLSGGPSNAAFCPPPPPPPCTTRSHPPPPPCTATGPPSAATSTASTFSVPTAGHAAAAVLRPSAPHIAPIVPGATASPMRGVAKLTDHGVTPEVLKQIGHPSRGAPAKAAIGVADPKGVVKAVGAGGIPRPHRRDRDVSGVKRGHRARSQTRGDHVRGEGTSLERRLDLEQGLMYFSFV